MTAAPSRLSRNPARDARIVALAANHTAEKVAEIIGDGCTRNAVIGVCRRAGVRVNGGRGKINTRPNTFAANWTGGTGAKAEPEPRTFKGRCEYIEGDPRVKGWSHCGAPVCRINSAYCAPHHARCYNARATEDSVERALARPYRSEVT